MANKYIQELQEIARALVNQDLFIIRGFNENKELKVPFSVLITALTGASMTPEQIRDALETLAGLDRLDASAIKNLPSGLSLDQVIIDALEAANQPGAGNPFATFLDLPDSPQTGNRIINPGTLVIDSTTSATLTGCEWVWEGVLKTYTGTLTLTDSPTDPNNRFDIITLSAANTPAVETGTPDPEPAVPNPATVGHLVVHTIYRPFSGADSVQPQPPASVYATKNQGGQVGNYAPIWQQTVTKNASYDFKIGFVGWASDYTSSNQRPLNGYVTVNFVTLNSPVEIDPNRVKVQTNDISFQSGDFVLVQSGTAQVTLYAKKTAFFQQLFFGYLGVKNSTVQAGSLVNNGSYASLPAGAVYPSWNGRGFVDSSGTTIQFDRPRAYGMGTALTGNLTVATAYADDSVMVKVIHNNTTEPTITVPGGVTKKLLSGSYTPSVDNLYLFIIDKDAAGDVVRVNYTISQDTL